jgi:hypothetical protein
MGELWCFERSEKSLRENINKTRFFSVGMGWKSSGAMKGGKNIYEET